jgi:hypothetical protein
MSQTIREIAESTKRDDFAGLTVNREEVAILMQLVTRGAAPGPGARALADLYDKVMAAGAELGVVLPPQAG